MIIYSLIPLLVVIGLLILKKINFKYIVNGLFWGIISIFLTYLIDSLVLPLVGFHSNIYDAPNIGLSFFAFIIAFFTAALPEELSKFLSINACIKKL